MMEENNNTEAELSFRDIILIVIEYFKEVIRSWKIPLLLATVFACLLGLYNKMIVPEFPGSLTFMVNEDEAEEIGGLSSLLGTLGIKGPGSKGSEHNLEKIVQLFRSRRIIENTLFQRSVVQGKDDYIANHLLDIYGLENLVDEYKKFGIAQRGWIDLLKDNADFRFKSDTLDKKDNLSSIIFNDVLYDLVVGNPGIGIDPMINSAIDETSGIMNVRASTLSQDLTISILEELYAELSRYYIDKTVEKQQKVYSILKSKNDSLIQVLAIADYALADFEDSNRSLVSVKGELKRIKLRRDAKIMEIMYGESIKQLEMAEFSLKRKTPYVQIIDWPKRPINPKRGSVPFGIILGTIVGIVLGISFVILRKVFRDVMAMV